LKHYVRILREIQRLNLDVRFFEILTMMALLEFKEAGCDYIVLECGIGGYLDATNIVKAPVCSTITSIGLDHTDLIGESINDIAYEKSGVIKNCKPCVLGPTA
jgi:dihydrofolate synthase/folylpolyglutamate synthase